MFGKGKSGNGGPPPSDGRFREVPLRRGRLPIEKTFVDRVIEHFDPIRGAARMRARLQTTMLEGAWNGASKSRRSMAGWETPSLSADGALLPDLFTLRDRSRDLVRNNPLATGAINTVVTRVVGTGLSLHPSIPATELGLTHEQATEWQQETKFRWNMWAESTWCDRARRLNFYGMQRLAMRSVLESGDVFAALHITNRSGAPNPLAVQLIEADRVTNPRGTSDTRDARGGIEFDEDGAPRSYHIYNPAKGGLYGSGIASEGHWIDAFGAASGRRNVLHVFDPRRVDQTRGGPYLAPVMEHLKQLGRYTEAEIDAAVLNAFFAVFIENPTGEGIDPLNSAVSGRYGGASDSPVAGGWDGTLTSGLAVDLPPGAKVTSANPGRPNEAFDPFVQAMLRQIGSALEIPFELLVKHFTSSYTAARAALLDFWLFVRSSRDWFEATFCQPVYEEWLSLEVVHGNIAAPGFFTSAVHRHAWSSATWTGDSMGVLDPQRETAAIRDALDLGLTTLERETMRRDGSNWEDNHAQQVRERNARVEGGLEQSSETGVQPPRRDPGPDQSGATHRLMRSNIYLPPVEY